MSSPSLCTRKFPPPGRSIKVLIVRSHPMLRRLSRHDTYAIDVDTGSSNTGLASVRSTYSPGSAASERSSLPLFSMRLFSFLLFCFVRARYRSGVLSVLLSLPLPCLSFNPPHHHLHTDPTSNRLHRPTSRKKTEIKRRVRPRRTRYRRGNVRPGCGRSPRLLTYPHPTDEDRLHLLASASASVPASREDERQSRVHE
ncbi:hypothetical protein B0H12DRAFT_79420 [Mycena haematopus]|nr:hypothetical protein B0H12DRAFT_79420 [Mycena haematopus]